MRARLARAVYLAIHFIPLLFAWIVLHTIKRSLLKQDIWIIREKRDEARDNGYHFYKYLRENYESINAYYAIESSSPDRHKVEKYGNLIEADSFKHCIYFLAAKFSISSQQYGAYPFRFSAKELNYVKKICNRRQKVVFLQHGIMQNKVPALEYGFCNIDYFITSIQREFDFIKQTYRYPNAAIGCTGMARFDHLYTSHVIEDKILVMPTWRKWLKFPEQIHPLGLEQHFMNSDYYALYTKLLTDEALIRYLRSNNYKLVFYMHYQLQPFSALFKQFENDEIIIADKDNYDVQDLLMTSKFMITDYSSVFFDFAYLNKPLLYYQFDKEQFRNGHYEEGYFSYENDGFGPCFESFENVRQYVFDMIDTGCHQPQKYNLRVKEFFNLRDNRNCERIFDAIKEL